MEKNIHLNSSRSESTALVYLTIVRNILNLSKASTKIAVKAPSLWGYLLPDNEK